jgi:tol-pal system protein YbgF
MRSRVPFAFASLSLALGTLGLGCAHTDAVADRQLAEMSETIGKVQAEQDRTDLGLGDRGMDGLTGLVDEGRASRTPASPPTARLVANPPAAPRVVQIGESDDASENDDPDDPSARPEIRVQGTPGLAPRRGNRTRGDARVEKMDPDSDGARSASSSSLDPEAKKSYEAALALVKARQYDRALESLSAFLVRWPDHPYVENATYWRGECYFARGEYLKAAEQFEAVVVRSGGTGGKSPDALLKMGMSHERLGAPDRAKEYWDRLRRDFPRSDAARKIPESSKNDTRGGVSPLVGPKESR